VDGIALSEENSRRAPIDDAATFQDISVGCCFQGDVYVSCGKQHRLILTNEGPEQRAYSIRQDGVVIP
jgi:hypothetical protein